MKKPYLLPLLLLPALLLSACTAQSAPPEAAQPRPLTQEEADWFNQYFAAWEEDEDGVTARPVGGFFTSTYDDVKDLDFSSFLGCFPSDEVLTDDDQAEYEALCTLPDSPWDFGAYPAPSRLPIPVRRLHREAVDQVLTQYAGITTADLNATSGPPYLEAYDAWYVDGDFGGDYFTCVGGEMQGDTALLWSAPGGADGSRLELTAQKAGEEWQICSFRNSGPDPERTLSALLSGLREDEVGEYPWYGVYEECLPPADLAKLIRTAAISPLDLPSLPKPVLWTLEVPIVPATNFVGTGTLYLNAGLEENVVEVCGGEGLPSGPVYLSSPELYQLVRVSRDYEGFINDSFYEKYRDLVDGYFDSRLTDLQDVGCVSWELSEFIGVLGTTKQSGKGVVAFRMNAAYRTDPPELAPTLLEGDAWVDSRLLLHGLDGQDVYLVTLDDAPVGITCGEEILTFIRDHWGEDVDPAELQAIVAAHAPGSQL